MTARQLAADEARRLIRIGRKGVLATNGSNQEKIRPRLVEQLTRDIRNV